VAHISTTFEGSKALFTHLRNGFHNALPLNVSRYTVRSVCGRCTKMVKKLFFEHPVLARWTAATVLDKYFSTRAQTMGTMMEKQQCMSQKRSVVAFDSLSFFFVFYRGGNFWLFLNYEEDFLKFSLYAVFIRITLKNMYIEACRLFLYKRFGRWNSCDGTVTSTCILI
jgi:hypothetical protein